MPSSYTHHRFGTQIISLMPADIRGPILRHRALFHMGLQGPDFLFYHNFIKKTSLFRLGSVYHERSGEFFFTQVCAHQRQAPSEAGFAYLHGLLAHYCLDSICHPFVYSMTDDTNLNHSELESEFDRYLIELDGYKKPHEINICRYMKLQKEDYAVISGFYPELSAEDVSLCIRNMSMALRLLTLPTAVGHQAVVAFTHFAGGNTAGMVMSIGPNSKCDHLNSKMLELYNLALARYPEFLEQLNAHMSYGESFGDLFSRNFNRG